MTDQETQLLTHPDGPPTAAMAPAPRVSSATTWFARWLPRWLMRTFTPKQATLAAATWVLVGVVAFAAAPGLGGHPTPPRPPKAPETSAAGPTTTSSPALARPATGIAPQRYASNVPEPTVAKPPPTRTITATVTIPEPTPTTTSSSETDKPDLCDKPDPPRRCDPTEGPST